MVKQDSVYLCGLNFIHTYSDSNFMIKKIGTDELYLEAYDVINFEYEETDIEIVKQ